MVEITKDGRVYIVPYPCYINDFAPQGWEVIRDFRDKKIVIETKAEEVIVEEPKVEEPKKEEIKEAIKEPKIEKVAIKPRGKIK